MKTFGGWFEGSNALENEIENWFPQTAILFFFPFYCFIKPIRHLFGLINI